MTTATHVATPLEQAGRAMLTSQAPLPQTCAVRLIDRRTGQTHRINGRPLVLFTKSPQDAVIELLAGRDASVWEARVERIGNAPFAAGANA